MKKLSAMNYNTIRKGFLLVAGTIAAATVMTACSGKTDEQAAKAEDEAVRVEVAKVDFRPVEQLNMFTGTVEADVVNNISPQSAMRIKKVYVEVGDRVSAGQKLADMDPNNLDQLRMQMENNELEFKRVDELYKIGGTSKSEWDAKKLAYDVSKRNYDNIMENTVLSSPISGVVTQRNYDSGDMFSMGNPLFVVEKINPVRLKINVSESLFTKVSKGMVVDFTLDVYGDEVFKAKVDIIYPTIDPNTRTFPVELVIENRDMRVRPGMFARVTLNYGVEENVVVPDRAVMKLTGSGDRYVYVVKDGKAEYRKVELGRRIDTEYEIRSGLNREETVVIAGQTRLKDGAKVEIVTKEQQQKK